LRRAWAGAERDFEQPVGAADVEQRVRWLELEQPEHLAQDVQVLDRVELAAAPRLAERVRQVGLAAVFVDEIAVRHAPRSSRAGC
jgi:hypothetical protein